MDRINHVKIVSPDPEAVDRFLREVLDIPAGWPLGDRPHSAIGSGAPASLTPEQIERRRGPARFDGFITGSAESRQFQIIQGEEAGVWAVAIGTRHLERAHDRCVERGIPCTAPSLTEWGDGAVRFFFAEVGGVLFEVMRAEAAFSS